jgi:hypothetical protein
MLPLSQATRCDDASLKSVNHFESQIRLDFGPKPYKARIRMQKKRRQRTILMSKSAKEVFFSAS